MRRVRDWRLQTREVADPGEGKSLSPGPGRRWQARAEWSGDRWTPPPACDRPRAPPTLSVAAAGQHADGLAGPAHPQLLQVHGGHGGAESGDLISARAARSPGSRLRPAPAPPSSSCEVTAAHGSGTTDGGPAPPLGKCPQLSPGSRGGQHHH